MSRRAGGEIRFAANPTSAKVPCESGSIRKRQHPIQSFVGWRAETDVFELGGYTVEKLLHSSRSAQLHCAVRDQDQHKVVLKRYAADVATLGTPLVEREFEMLGRFDAPVIQRALAVEHGRDQPVLVLEWFPGETLAQATKDGGLTTGEFCDLALQITRALGIVHEARVLHRDIKPRNVLIDRRTLRAQLIDFGLAVQFGSAMTAEEIWSGTRESGGALQFVSPEQTGRMDRGMDFRSDLYSLGATLYWMLTGRPPFVCRDTLELVHSLMARLPTPPIVICPDVPETVSRVVLKLLAKEPNERYQTAAALYADLEWCRDQLAEQGHIGTLARLGAYDVPGRPVFGSAVYGREREIQIVVSAFANVCRGESEFVLISGSAGVGKSSILMSLREPLAKSGGYLARSKFEPYGLDRPYAGLADAFEGWAHQLLTESEERVRMFADELRNVLGSILRVVIELVPSLEFILGESDGIPEVDARASKARTALAVRRMVSVCARPEHPLVLVLDDLQWADTGSLDLLEEILKEPPIGGLMVVGTFRDGEVDASHPVRALLARVASRRRATTHIELGPLSDDAAAQMLAAGLERDLEEVGTLAQLIRVKIGNYPLLIQQFISQLHECGMLSYARLEGGGAGWTWDARKVAMAEIPEDAVELVAGRINNLSERTRDALTLASCVGNEFDAALLAKALDQSRGDLEDALFEASDAGVIVPCRQGFRFAHDRLREAIQDLLEPDERDRRHYDMAVLLSEGSADTRPSERVLEIADHLTLGSRHVMPSFRLRAIGLFLDAARKGLQLGAADKAAAYASSAHGFFAEGDWSVAPEMAFELYMLLIETAYQTRDMQSALDWIEALDRRSLGEVERTQVAEKRIRVYCLSRAPEDTVRYTLSALERIGIRWPFRPSRVHVSVAVSIAECALRGYANPLSLLPDAAKRRAPLASMLVRAAGGTMNLVDAQLVLLACAIAVCNTPTAELIAGYEANKTFLFPSGVACRRAIVRIEAQLRSDPNPISRARAEFLLQALIRCWIEPRRHTIQPLDLVSECFLELGDLQFAQFARLCSIVTRILVGDWIEPVERDMRDLLAEEASPGGPYLDIDLAHGAYERLLDADAALASIEEPVSLRSPSGEARLIGPLACVTRMLVLAVHGRFAAVFAESERIYADLFRRAPGLHLVDHMFLRGLAAAALVADVRGRRRRGYIRSLHTARRWLRRWARAGPDFEHMHLVLRAEGARIRRHHARAERLYSAAAARAEQIGHRHHAGLVHERRASLLSSMRRYPQAEVALDEAVRCYRAWGAVGKAAELQRERTERW